MASTKPGFRARGAALYLLVLLGPLCIQAEPGKKAGTVAASTPPPRTVLSEQTPDWLTVGAAIRLRGEGRSGNGFREGAEDYYGLSRLHVNIDVKPTSWFKLSFQGQDSRSPGKENSSGFFRDPFDVRQAYVEFGASERHKVRLKVGRQELKYGAQRLLGPLDWGNTSRQFDAAKVTLGDKDLHIDFFAPSVVRIDPEGFNRRRDGENLHGAYATLNRWAPNSTLETYLLWKTTLIVISESSLLGDADVYTAGFRFVKPLPHGFDAQAEVASQFGSFGGDEISAWGAYRILAYTVDKVAGKPRFSVEYQYGSGDSNPTDGKHGWFLGKMSPGEIAARKKAAEEFKRRYTQ